jgi:peptide/nickel transport system ATP-binding protein
VFHTRCPRKLGAVCEREVPPMRRISDGHQMRCHIPPEDLARAQSA